MDVLGDLGLQGECLPGLTGVWVERRKVAAIGVGCRRWITQHGLALNVDRDLEPFGRINPCGYAGMRMTQLADLVAGPIAFAEVSARMREQLAKHLGYAQQQTLTNVAIV